MKFTNVVIVSCIILVRTVVGVGVPVNRVARANEVTTYVPRPLPPLVLPNRKHLSKGGNSLTGPIVGSVPGLTAAGRGVVRKTVGSGVGPISPSLASPM